MDICPVKILQDSVEYFQSDYVFFNSLYLCHNIGIFIMINAMKNKVDI